MPGVKKWKGIEYLTNNSYFKVSKPDFPGQHNNRHMVLPGTVIQGDGGGDSSLGMVRNAKLVSRNLLGVECWLDLTAASTEQVAAFEAGNFNLKAHDPGGIAHYVEITFTNTLSTNQKKENDMSQQFAVNPKQGPDPLRVPCLCNAVKEKAGIKSEPSKPSTNAADGQPEPLRVPSLIEACQAKAATDADAFKEMRDRQEKNTPIDQQIAETQRRRKAGEPEPMRLPRLEDFARKE